MLDHIEALERAAEDRMLEMTKGMPAGYFRCGCGQPEELDHAVASGTSPYDEPMCRGCVRVRNMEMWAGTVLPHLLPRG